VANASSTEHPIRCNISPIQCKSSNSNALNGTTHALDGETMQVSYRLCCFYCMCVVHYLTTNGLTILTITNTTTTPCNTTNAAAALALEHVHGWENISTGYPIQCKLLPMQCKPHTNHALNGETHSLDGEHEPKQLQPPQLPLQVVLPLLQLQLIIGTIMR
jgi:hypothetical protein